MNDTNDREWHRLFSAALNGTLTDAERPQLATLLKSSPEARQLWFLYHDNECGLSELKNATAIRAAKHTTVNPGGAPRAHQTSPWLQWRSVTAAAAGLAIGLFGASVVYGIAAHRGPEKRTPLAVYEPGFEDLQMPLTIGFPAGAGRWSGDAGQVVAAENGVQAKQGKFMLRLESVAKSPLRIFQVLDLQSLPSDVGGASLEIEISASFATAVAESSVRYMIRAFAVTEAPADLDAAWFDRRDESIASVTKGLDAMPGAKGWQTLGVSIKVPRAARSLVLFLGVRTPDRTARNVPHYLDDVHVSLLTSGPLP
jgi:hypothetical protein